MGHASASIDLNVPPNEVWELIGGFNSLSDWMPYIVKSEAAEGGRVRHLVNPKGQVIIERLEKFDQAGRTYSYSIVQAPFPVDDFLATITVRSTDDGKTSRVEWDGTYTPKDMNEEEAHKHFLGIFESGLTALTNRFATIGT